MFKIGTHNSMSYLIKSEGLMAVVGKLGKCQNLTYNEQYDFGVRYFDLRIRFDHKGIPSFAHGLLDFRDVDAYTVLDYLNTKGDCVVNIVMESNALIRDTQNNQFIGFCKEIEEKYLNVVFNGGWSKYPKSGTVLYKFKYPWVAREEVYKHFDKGEEALHVVIDAVKKKDGDNRSDEERKEVIHGGIEEFKNGPIFYARQDNPGFWKLVNEERFIVMDFIEIGAPGDWKIVR